MHHNIEVVTLKYIGKSPFAYKAQNHKTYTLYSGDTLTLPKNHFSRYLQAKKTLFRPLEPAKTLSEAMKNATNAEVENAEVENAEVENAEVENAEVENAEVDAEVDAEVENIANADSTRIAF